MTRLQVKNLGFWYNKSLALLEGISFDVAVPLERGRIVAVMGSSGAGKSTLLRLLTGRNERPCMGQIVLTPLDAPISYLPQEPVLFEHLSLSQNANFHRNYGDLRGLFREVVLEETLSLLQINTLLDRHGPTSTLSGGEKQRLSLARALSIEPRLLLLDEPCTGLDGPVKHDFLVRFRTLVDRKRLLVMYVTHHPDEALLLADDILFLEKHPERPIMTLKSVDEFRIRPPSLAAARTLDTKIVNVVPCFKAGQVLKLSESGPALCRCAGLDYDGQCILAFRPGTAQVSRSELVVEKAGESSQYWFVIVNDRIVAVSRKTETEQPQGLTLQGKAFVFPSEFQEGSSVHLEPLK